MLSESDQLVSQTLHHVAPIPTATKEIEEQKPNYFQRIVTRSKQQLRSPEGQQIPTTASEESLVDTSEEFPAAKTTYYFAESILSSERASSDILAFAGTIQQVRQGIREATRLYVSPAVSSFFDTYPNKRIWATECLQEVQSTLNAIGTDMESSWGREEDSGTVASKLKFEWGLKIQKRSLKRQQQLHQCHIDLMGAVHMMQTAELCSRPGVIIPEPIYEAPVRPLVHRDERDTLRGPYSRHKYRSGYNYASVSSLTLASENDKDDDDTASINSTPAELAGSTPSEPSKSQDVHYFLSLQTSRESLTDSPGLFRRSRASSDHVRQTAISGVRSRASIDSIIGRHDFTPFTPSAFEIPMTARRYRATSVDIQSHNEKYKSRAQQPYVLRNQSSLDDSLNDYTHPDTAIKSLQSEEWAPLATRPGLSSSLPKSLTINPPIRAVQGAMATPGMATNSALQFMEHFWNNRNEFEELPPSRQAPEPNQNQGALEPVVLENTCTNHEPHKMFGNGANNTKAPPSDRSSIKSAPQSSMSSLSLAFSQDEGLVCRPSGQRPSQRRSKNAPNTSGSVAESTAPSREIDLTVRAGSQLPAESLNTNKTFAGSTDPTPRLPMIVIDDACMPILATETELPEDIHDGNEDSIAFQQRLQGQMETNPVAERPSSVLAVEQSVGPEPKIESLVLKGTHSFNEELEPQVVPSNNSPAAIAANGSTESREDLVGKKPMSAQAKRRAAHARRMHLAFGNDANT